MPVNQGIIYTIGETVFDIIMDGLMPLAATPGGSMLNAAVSLGRVGLEPQFISEIGNDNTGKRILEFLVQQGVDCRNIKTHESCRTTVALAYLDDKKKATYDFFHSEADSLEFNPEIPFTQDDMLLLGSYYSLKKARRNFIRSILQNAKNSGASIVYDPNIRKAHLADITDCREHFLENLSFASLVKGSDEDFELLFGISEPEAIYSLIQPYCKKLIITRGKESVELFSPGYCKSYEVPSIEPVSTIGAGDNFNAGLVYGLALTGNQPDKRHPGECEWDFIIQCAITAASVVCESFENFVPINFTFPSTF